MKLRSADDGHNSYVLYSDMLFNLLILFVLIVLALVLRMHGAIRDNVVGVADAEQRATAAEEKVTEAQAREASLEEEARASTANETAAKKEASELAGRVRVAVQSDRFSIPASYAKVAFALDHSGEKPRFVLVNAAAFDHAFQHFFGETVDEFNRRNPAELYYAIHDAPRFSEEDLAGALKALEVNLPFHRQQGSLDTFHSEVATRIASGWEDQDGKFDQSKETEYLSRQDVSSSSLEKYDRSLISHLEATALELRRSATRSVPILHFSSARDESAVTLGGKEYPLTAFKAIAQSFGGTGVHLQYDGLDNAPPPPYVRTFLFETGFTANVPDSDALGKLRRSITGWLGISMADVTRNAKEAESFGYTRETGVLVQQTVPNSPAAGKLQAGDIIEKFNGKDVTFQTLQSTIATAAPNSEVTMTIFRDRKERELTLRLGAQPENVEELGR